MSAPTKQLGKLSIGGSMSASGSKSQPDPYEERPSDSSSEEESSSDEEDNDSLAEATTIRGGSTITYDLRMLSKLSRARAISGLTGDFAVDKCQPIRGGGFQFQVADHGKVQLSERPSCSCREFQKENVACRHIFWIIDQLHRWVLPGRPPTVVPLSHGGECSRFSPMVEMIGDNMENIAKKVQWPYTPVPGSPTGSNSGSSMTRPEKARDIMSAFNETTMPDEFRPDLVETISEPRTPEQCVVQGDFEATMFRLAVHDENVYTGLRRVMPAGARAAIFFDKIQRRSRNLLADFDKYCQTGAPRRGDGISLEIPIVIQELNNNVQQIFKNITSRAPHGPKGAAEALIDLLRAISQRNYDAFEGHSWGRPAPADEGPHDRNLFSQLIGIQKPESDGFFIIDCLEALPEDILSQWSSQLTAILNDIQTSGAPVPYLMKLQSIIVTEPSTGAVLGGGPPGVGASGQKRPAVGPSAAGRKRTK